jgi:two-component system cell cycle response regulator DivK
MKLASVLLGMIGVQVIEATNAADAISLARQHVPDLILMDIQLPGMSGLAASEILKDDPVTAPIPVIALTALAMHEEEQRIRAGAFVDYIAKPFQYMDFLARIKTALPGKNLTGPVDALRKTD